MFLKSKKGCVFLTLIFFASFMFNVSADDLAVIITHGSPGKESPWHQEGGDFYEVLKIAAEQRDGIVEDFKWDQPIGGFSEYEIMNGASRLALRVLELLSHGKVVVIIAHSFGGYVARAASQFLNPRSKDFVCRKHDGLGRATAYDEEEMRRVKTHFTGLHRMVWRDQPEERSAYGESNYLINFLFTLGTPNDVFDIHADADVIKNFCNIYSNGDIVQEVVGSRKLPESEDSNPRFVDVGVDSIEGYSRCGNCLSCCLCLPCLKRPSHEGLHNQIIAKWVLDIPQRLVDVGIGEQREDSIHFNSDAVMNLFREDEPQVRADR